MCQTITFWLSLWPINCGNIFVFMIEYVNLVLVHGQLCLIKIDCNFKKIPECDLTKWMTKIIFVLKICWLHFQINYLTLNLDFLFHHQSDVNFLPFLCKNPQSNHLFREMNPVQFFHYAFFVKFEKEMKKREKMWVLDIVIL